ncbi:hypothetical protein [Parablautia sp. Marseille-Q6255]|nr:hypothetical protein [Parablautia sp. Marseille-Q6255]
MGERLQYAEKGVAQSFLLCACRCMQDAKEMTGKSEIWVDCSI